MGRKIRIDMTGLRFGRLVGIDFAFRKSGHAHWLFRCDCGAETIASGAAVRAGNTTSCGCYHRELCAARLTEHGFRAEKRHGPTYRAWQQMRFKREGEICQRWFDDFTGFLDDLGERPNGTKLAQKNPQEPFGPTNCFWQPLESRAARARRAWQGRQRDA